ncbi:sulfatase family protein [Labilibaculum antarcticum]|uniref:Arylsulfatase n=1 Tax=Labilibaculum antarcticum TaxID=1717717 RepID=A0A1Y1CDM4_9BACT|nr:arylsulfatase [Labilibaculum antarcticum]BAX78434.1 arylsulfatase [Labilibaculum antarcticum]
MNWKQKLFSSFTVAAILSMSAVAGAVEKKENSKPNIVVIYVDDLGYGDLSCTGATGVQTPNVDKLAQNGILFTDAHCSAATCTPSRYSLLTGSYAFRKNAAVLQGDAPLLIEPGTPTLPSMLQQEGYKTAVIGKWHLGLGNGNVDWNGDVKPGPLEIGFDYSYLIPATGDRVPCVLLENHKVLGLDQNDPITVSYDGMVGTDPTGTKNPDLLRYGADKQHSNTIVNGISRIGYMTGGNAARWKDETIPFQMLSKARSFIDENQETPFFLYFAFLDIHVPRLPALRFAGKSTMGVRGDAIVQMDYITGQLVDYLKSKGLLDNTLIVFSSDNGPVINDGYDDKAMELLGDHKPGGIYRGGKYSAYEAGTRVPTIAYWPNKIKGGQTSNALVGHVDLYASIASLVNHELQDGEAPDSFNQLETYLGTDNKGRAELVEEAYTLSIREGKWKYIQATKNAGGWIKTEKNIESGLSTKAQLYNLEDDPKELNNLAESNPKLVVKLDAKLQKIKNETSSRK